MDKFPKYKYCKDNGLVYELGEHELYYPILHAISTKSDCCHSVAAKTKIEYMKEHQLELYVDLVANKKLNKYIQDYLGQLEKQTNLIYSQMDKQDAMGRLLAEEMARDNLL